MTMKTFNKLILSLAILNPFFSAHSDPSEAPCPHQVFVGPEIYHVTRTREGGAEQKGWLYGVRGGYDYIKRNSFYYGIDALYAQGTLKGRTSEARLKSDLTDINVEGRLGYTFQTDTCHYASFTPYIGIGYFWEINKYKHPSPLPIHFNNNFYYVPFGFLSSIYVTPELTLGFNYKGRFIIDGKTKVTHDASFDDVSLRYVQRIQSRLELPITYYFCWSNQEGAVAAVPFYEFRNYGHHPNFPFDFLETKFKIFGVTLKLLYLF